MSEGPAKRRCEMGKIYGPAKRWALMFASMLFAMAIARWICSVFMAQIQFRHLDVSLISISGVMFFVLGFQSVLHRRGQEKGSVRKRRLRLAKRRGQS